MRTTITCSLIAAVCLAAGCTSSRLSRQTATADKPPASPEVAAADVPKIADAAKTADTATPKPAAASSTDADPAGTPEVADAAKPVDSATDVPKKTETPASGNVAETSPFQPSRPRDTGKDDKAETGKVADAAKDDANTVAKTSHALDKELLLLIDRELSDATPEERAEWFGQLKQVDAAVVPDILRARRLSLQLARKAGQPSFQGAGLSQPQLTAGPGAATQNQSQAAVTPVPAGQQQPGMGWGNPWGSVPNSPAQSDPFGVVPAGHSTATVERGLVPAYYEAPPQSTGSEVQHAVMRPDTGSTAPAIILQNHEVVASASPTMPYAGHVPAYGGLTTPEMGAATNALPAGSGFQAPAGGVAWPPPKAEAAPASGLNSVTSHLQFGSNLVQNMVGLVPGRAAQSANTPVGPIVQTSGIQPVAEGFQAQLEQTTAFLEQEVAGISPGTTPESQAAYIRQHVALRLLYLMGQHQERALTAIPGIPPAEQEFWQQLIWGMVNALDTEQIPDARNRATQTIAQLNNAIRRLQEQAELQIRNVAFCRQILYFGNYEKLARADFSPGQEVLLYAEIDHFKSEPTAEGQYRTLLRSTIEILSPAGDVRKQIEFPATEDLCSTYRRDYFHNYQFRIPERMPLGPHILKLTVFDELSGKLTSYSTNFLVK